MYKRQLQFLLRLLVLTCATAVMVPCPTGAQAFKALYSFSDLNSVLVNSDGAFPTANLIPSNNLLYGTASQGGEAAGGTIYQINQDGTGFKVLFSFTPPNGATGDPGDGAYPLGGLVLSGDTLFGTTSSGGAADSGIVFKIKVDGTGFATIHTFTAADLTTYANTDGAYPWASLALVGNTLYGTATRGGDAGSGTIFKINTDGTGFLRLYSFSALDPAASTNADGAYPLGGLAVLNNALYGTTYRGGSTGTGTVFRVNLDGTGFTNLHNAEGGSRASLLASGTTLYGTTESGGSFGGGTVFKLNADGSGFTNLEEFANDPGNGPWAGLILNGNTLYGTTYAGGSLSMGSVFGVNIDGTGFTNVYSFSGSQDGSHPQGALAPAGNAMFGTASEDGTSSAGTIFRLTSGQGGGPVELSITVSGGNVILRWPATATGFTLQSTDNLAAPISWTAVSGAPVIVNGFYTVTTPISVAARFYRLSP